MKTLLITVLVAFTFTAIPVVAEELPEIAPVDEPAVPSLDAPATE
jgi:hypothetical protein